MRWHPIMVKWALNLKMLSSSPYHASRTSGFMLLPRKRTLRDYVHFYPWKPGFSSGVNDHLIREAKIDSLTKIQKHVIILLDAMKVREDVVFDKLTGEVIGVVNLGDVNNELKSFETEGFQYPRRDARSWNNGPWIGYLAEISLLPFSYSSYMSTA